jgi:threonine aldolase
MKPLRTFASDNCASVHPRVMEALLAANSGHAESYGKDRLTRSAIAKFQEHFGRDVDVYFVFNGTAANVLSLKAITDSFNAVLCSECSHLNRHECGAPERLLGCKVIALPSSHGKIRLADIKPWLADFDEHYAQPRAISITQATELGTLYGPDEVREIARVAHQHGLLLHMDGSRICNAAAALKKPLRAVTRDLGVDVLSFGGTKNGLMCGDAVVFFDRRLSRNFKYIRKQGLQLGSKMRYVGAQFDALLTDGLWLECAAHANRMAALLARLLRPIPGVRIVEKVETNVVFAQIPKSGAKALQKKHVFHMWDTERSVARWMTAFDTTPEDVSNFAAAVRAELA